MKRLGRLKTFLSLAWGISKSYYFLTICSALFGSAQVFINVIIPKYLIDAIEYYFSLVEEYKEEALKTIILLVVMLIVANFLINLVNKTLQRLLAIKNIYVEEKFNELMGKKIMEISYQHIEDPYYLDLKERAVFACSNQGALNNMLTGTARMLKEIITIAGLATILITFNWIIVLILALAILLTTFINRWFYKYREHFYQSLIPINRCYMYYLNLVWNQDIAKDVRIYKLNDMIVNKIDMFSHKIFVDEFTPYFHKQGMVSGFTNIINNLQAGIVYLYLALNFKTIGNFSLYASSAFGFTASMNSLFDALFICKQMMAYLDPFMEFMELPEEKKEKNKLLFNGSVESIRFENVSFRYPRTEALVLDDVSFEIHKGEKISIVGLNGAGKTTLVKLLCRLYTPASGKIYVNGKDIFEYDYLSYLKEISAVFQDYRLFDFSILENIALDDAADKEKVEKILADVELKEYIDKLPKGIDTHLNKQFDPDGTDMSGGQKQKLAIARALYKNASLVILDEPTSALDPIAEAEIYQNFNEMVQDRTAIYISHRLSSSVFCDKVLIIDGGKVVDFAPHAELMKKEGSLYYKLFSTQAKNYQI